MRSLALLYCILCVSLVSCTRWSEEPKPTQKMVYLSTWQESYKKEILSRCHKESIVLSLAMFEARGRVQSRGEVVQMEKFILWSCYRHFGIMI